MARICDHCKKDIICSTLAGNDSIRISENVNLSITLHIDGRMDICKECIQKIIHLMLCDGREWFGLMELQDEREVADKNEVSKD